MSTDVTADPLNVYSPAAIAWARKECASALAIIRENYRPSEPMEFLVISAFLYGAGAAFNMDAELGDVASLENTING